MPDEQPARILVVDDNPATLYSTARILRAANFSVTEAATGQDALDLAFQGTDLVMLDVNLPDIHGFEVCQRLREDPRTARLPIIHISATFVKEIDKAQGLDAGSDGYLTHPIEPPVLIATVKAFLRARKAEEGLGESDARFKSIFENALSGIVLLDHDLGVLEANPAMCRLLQRTREEIIGATLSSLMISGDEKKSLEIGSKLRAEQAWRGTFPLVRSDGKVVHLEWYISAQSSPSVAIATDISERMALEEQRQDLLSSERAARAEAERLNRLKDEFLGNLSHELRTPLNSILLWVQTLQRHLDDRAQLVQGLQAVERNTRVQTQLISDLLDVSRITSGKLVLEVEPVNPAVIIKSALDVLSPAASAKDMTIETALDPSAGLVSGDPSRLQQIVWNLVNNAIKFTPKGGRIQIKLERVESNVEISVADNGQGVKAELLPFLFERFRQGETGKTRRYGGLGLGLAIAKHLTELHGGSVSAASEGEGCGAKFSVRLPVIAAYSAGSGDAAGFGRDHAASGVTGEDLDGLRVLVVDDNPDAGDVMSQILTQAGATVANARSVDEALLRLDMFNPDVLVSDIGMPGRDGYDLIREIRARGYSGDKLPAIALTALARPEDRRRALLEGFQLHVSKPNDAGELTTAIAAVVGRRALPAEPSGEGLSSYPPAHDEDSSDGLIQDRDRRLGRWQRAIRGLTSGIRRSR